MPESIQLAIFLPWYLNDYLAHLTVDNDLVLEISDTKPAWFFDLHLSIVWENLNQAAVVHCLKKRSSCAIH